MVSPVVIVDDDQENLDLLCAILKHGGFETIGMTNGCTALEVLACVTPSVVILDLLMTPINGFELSGRIREMPHLADIPIIMLSVQAEFLILHPVVTPRVNFLAKPVKLQDLLGLVYSLSGAARRSYRPEFTRSIFAG